MVGTGRTLQWDPSAPSTRGKRLAHSLASRRVEKQIDRVRQAGDNSLLLRREILHLERNLTPSTLSLRGAGRGVQVGCCAVSLLW